MTEENVKKKSILKRFQPYLFIIIVVGLSALLINERGYNKMLLEKNQEYKIIVDKLRIEKDTTTSELIEIKERVENIKTLDDLMHRDIKLYIKTNYPKIPRSVAEDISINIIKFGKQYNISPILLVGIIQVESIGFDPISTGPKTKYGHACGLMQVMPEWAKKFGYESFYDLYDIDTNIESGCRVFNIHLEEGNGDISKALYLYVNKEKSYVTKVYTAMGQFVAFRSTIKIEKDTAKSIPTDKEDEEDNEPGTDKKSEKNPKRNNESTSE